MKELNIPFGTSKIMVPGIPKTYIITKMMLGTPKAIVLLSLAQMMDKTKALKILQPTFKSNRNKTYLWITQDPGDEESSSSSKFLMSCISAMRGLDIKWKDEDNLYWMCRVVYTRMVAEGLAIKCEMMSEENVNEDNPVVADWFFEFVNEHHRVTKELRDIVNMNKNKALHKPDYMLVSIDKESYLTDIMEEEVLF